MTDNQDTEKYLLDKINNGEDLNDSELTLLVTTFKYTERTIEIEGSYETIATIAKLSNRYFYLEWEFGTDSYDREKSYTFFEQPVEVHLEIRTEEHERWVDSYGQVLL
ncbi:hypothetical protein BHC47_06085 [Snodgrassella alvi]|uniref:Uncharacterized protein n=1 Tax=Snodgrassella alvi TaxID=1196083 RepID=A0A2N9Y3M0_9NEIS|nr:hypothetical protein [Snodgrassella alvi]PIT61627.1 hypothetical protein BHC56_01125 [Snodgrassella alvi]PIT62057.1 hypothetical protein BHC47_06085 [Snodgrassella alvi]